MLTGWRDPSFNIDYYWEWPLQTKKLENKSEVHILRIVRPPMTTFILFFEKELKGVIHIIYMYITEC